MCSIKAHERMHPAGNDYTSSHGNILMSPKSTVYVLLLLGLTIKCIDS